MGLLSVFNSIDSIVQGLDRFNFNSLVNELVSTDSEPVYTNSILVYYQFEAFN